jgi:hypothetical protein
LVIENLCYQFSFDDLMMEVKSLMSSIQSAWIELKAVWSMYSVSCKSSNRYSVSEASFSAIESLWIKSVLDSACIASFTLAPI